mmetsp:Transcript_5327/g.19443  ORF Transcript_5327/g.19443 Transcript_5327/m.19443 type:complete len:201 (-) Transcript_5327:1329-1931(-)
MLLITSFLAADDEITVGRRLSGLPTSAGVSAERNDDDTSSPKSSSAVCAERDIDVVATGDRESTSIASAAGGVNTTRVSSAVCSSSASSKDSAGSVKFSARFSSPNDSPPRRLGGVFGAVGIIVSPKTSISSSSSSPVGVAKFNSASGFSNSTSSGAFACAFSLPSGVAPCGPYVPASSRSKFERAILDNRKTFTLSRKL